MSLIFKLFFALLALGAAGIAYIKIDQKRAASLLVEAQTRLDQVKVIAAERALAAKTLKRHYEVQRLLYDTNQNYTEVITVMQELEKEVESQKKRYQSVIDQRRNSARGKVIAHVELTDGRVLTNAKVTNFDDLRLTLQTEQGIIKVNAKDLPASLKELFRVDLINPVDNESVDKKSK